MATISFSGIFSIHNFSLHNLQDKGNAASVYCSAIVLWIYHSIIFYRFVCLSYLYIYLSFDHSASFNANLIQIQSGSLPQYYTNGQARSLDFRPLNQQCLETVLTVFGKLNLGLLAYSFSALLNAAPIAEETVFYG